MRKILNRPQEKGSGFVFEKIFYGLPEDRRLSDLIKEKLSSTYPEINVEVRSNYKGTNRKAVFFTEKKFKNLYPLQRYHCIEKRIPHEFLKTHLNDTIWFELAPGEIPEELIYHDEQIVDNISSDIMENLHDKGFFKKLQEKMYPGNSEQQPIECKHDFSISKQILYDLDFCANDQFDIFHVLMSKGAYCDCEILYNIIEKDNLRKKYWDEKCKVISD